LLPVDWPPGRNAPTEPVLPTLYHFSDKPGIARFEPHRAPTSAVDDALVWAIDEWHAPMYYVPRQCPRACFWAGPATTADDRERWLAGAHVRMVICVESGWLDRIRTATLYRYTMPESTFEWMGHEGGHWASRVAVVPLSVEPMPDLLTALAEANVELRATPSLIELWRRVIKTSLNFSGTRLRNAIGYAPGVFD
jgi:hypothetical protein